MPFGVKTDNKGRKVNFDQIYRSLIKEAIEECDLDPIRADEELLGGSIHKPMIERLVLCDFAIADLTSLNPNVFYELGLRHAIREHTTIQLFAFDAPPPFDLNMQRLVQYELDQNGKLINLDKAKDNLVAQLKACKEDATADSPVYQLVDDWNVSHSLSHEKTDVFRDRVNYDNGIKEKLFKARNTGKEEVIKVYDDLKPIKDKSVGVIVDLFLSLRAVGAYEEMISCYQEMDAPVQQLKMIREQLGFAYNRAKNYKEAEKVLREVIAEFGADPETNGILGRVYKDLYKFESEQGNSLSAKSYLRLAIQNYKDGFDADWRDSYPGVNLVTLLGIQGNQEELNKYLPIVEFAVERKIAKSEADYWDKATLSELAVLGQDYKAAENHLIEGLALIPDREYWMLETTLNNLDLIKEGRERENTLDDGLLKFINAFSAQLDKLKKDTAPG